MAEPGLLTELDEAEHCRCGKTHEECAEDGGCRWSRLDSSEAEAVRLLEYALHLRRNGENAPGGTETWAQWDRDAETFLRARIEASGA
jgi:hypothetical protein